LNPRAKTGLRIAGWLLSFAALAYFLHQVAKTGLRLPPQGLAATVAIVVAGGLAYALSVALLAWLWTRLACAGKGFSATERTIVAASYLTSQFAKYLPGNVFQYLARHALGRRLGIGHGALAAAALIEALLLASAAAILVLALGMPVLHAVIPWVPQAGAGWAIAMLLVLPLLRYLPRRSAVTAWIPRYPMPTLALLLSGYLVFFSLFGGLFVGLLAWSNVPAPMPAHVVGGSSAAWLVGYLVPGAPAGAGLREAALSLAAGGKASPGVLSAIVLFRLVTLSGDFLAFLLGRAIDRTRRTRRTAM
jgi:hypothetical protein